MAYKVSDRAKEWTTYAGIAVAAVAVVVPQMIPTQEWTQLWGAGQLLLGAAMIFLPQSAGTTAVENDALTLLQAFSAKVPPQYSAAMQPFMAVLAKAAMQPPPTAAPATAAPPVTPEPIPGILIPQPAGAPAGDPAAGAATPPAT
jgi:hypothetical protein